MKINNNNKSGIAGEPTVGRRMWGEYTTDNIGFSCRSCWSYLLIMHKTKKKAEQLLSTNSNTIYLSRQSIYTIYLYIYIYLERSILCIEKAFYFCVVL